MAAAVACRLELAAKADQFQTVAPKATIYEAQEVRIPDGLILRECSDYYDDSQKWIAELYKDNELIRRESFTLSSTATRRGNLSQIDAYRRRAVVQWLEEAFPEQVEEIRNRKYI